MGNGLFPPSKRDRRARIRKLELALTTKEDTESYKSVIAKFCLNEGLSLRTIREYLRFLKLAGRIGEEISI